MSGFSRRDFLKMSGLTAGGLMLGAMAGKAHAAARENELNILVWEGYNADNVLDPFRAEFKTKVSAGAVISDPDAVNKLRAGESKLWDIVNLNNPFARSQLWPAGLIRELPQDEFKVYFDNMLPSFKWPYKWAMSLDNKHLLGMVQRFGPFSFVVNTDVISRESAEDQGFNLFLDPKMKGRYGLLTWANWNIIHMSIAAGFSPFRKHTPEELRKFKETAEYLFANAKVLSDDQLLLNQALISKEIDCYFSGGTYTSSVPRHEGYNNVRAITPKSGPMEGKGGVVWIELTSVVNNPNLSGRAHDFLHYIMRPTVSHQVAFSEGAYNTVSQMGDPKVFAMFSKEELNTLQYDSLEWELAHCTDFDINPDEDAMYEIYTAARRN
jgi:spermidine/putrescine transport system substrate-binding protein